MFLIVGPAAKQGKIMDSVEFFTLKYFHIVTVQMEKIFHTFFSVKAALEITTLLTHKCVVFVAFWEVLTGSTQTCDVTL